MRLFAITAILLGLLSLSPLQQAEAQSRVGFIDSEYILDRIPEYEGILQRLDAINQGWREEIQELQLEIEEMQREFDAREILFTEEVREQRMQEIRQKKRDRERLIDQRFGPNGEYFRQQKELLEPLQRRILEATQRVAERGNYDYVFDRSGDFMFLYTRQSLNLSNDVLIEMGIQLDEQDLN